MTKLKTLKDIKYAKVFVPFKSKPSIEPVVIIDYKSKLKQEAINHILILENKNTNFEEVIKIQYLIQWIKHFFNITMEDIK